jgi:hypothetical protein
MALSVMVTAAANAPPAVGAKWPWMVQFAPAARLVPQLLANTNEDALAPVTAMLAIDKAALPLFVITTVCDPLDVPTVVVANARLVGESVTGDPPETVTVTTLDVDEGYVPLPEKIAVIELAPEDREFPTTVKLQFPEANVQLPSTVVPALNETVPVTFGGVST